ncbi:MAG: HNH endonuclease [Anaerolineales bacterium]|nr:HNH endonuclease [Anaerolineales bacterium]
MPRNPNWTRDELILALDLYFRLGSAAVSESHHEITALSRLLNELPIHPSRAAAQHFRNAASVYMKLSNFKRLDPDYAGKGLDAGSKQDEVVWEEFASRRDLLARTAAAIRSNVQSMGGHQGPQLIEEDNEFLEGRLLARLHTVRERNPALVERKKRLVLSQTGRLACEVCSFDFAIVYGRLGHGFAECHHLVPLSELDGTRAVLPEDLAVVCANCHRMLHRSRPMISVLELRGLLAAPNRDG